MAQATISQRLIHGKKYAVIYYKPKYIGPWDEFVHDAVNSLKKTGMDDDEVKKQLAALRAG